MSNNKGISKNVINAYENLILYAPEDCPELNENIEYIRLGNEHSKLIGSLLTLIPEEHINKANEILNSLDETDGAIGTIEFNTLYEKGINDGIGMLKLLKVL